MSCVYIIAGPTASGKSARALALAERIGGVIINADSIQLYKDLPILSAAPSTGERGRIPHCLYGILGPEEVCSARTWRDLAIKEIEATHARGQTPVLVGGTGFYLKALVGGFSPIPDVPTDVRAQASVLQKDLGNPGFHAALAARDPVMAARLHPHDTQRLIRAWEVWAFTGRSLADWQAGEKTGGLAASLTFEYDIVLPDRAALYDSCNRRFDAMMRDGALEEAAEFDEKIRSGRVSENAPPIRALGFRELQAFLRGQIGREEAVIRAKARTRHYAKRQVTWFRHQMP